MKFKCTIEIYKNCAKKCNICGKVFSGKESDVYRKALMHVIFRHPIKSAQYIYRDIKKKS